jgi:nicotinamidase/pyrazinamidase
MDKYTLIIVDFQKDFCDPSGSLYVNGAPQAMDHILQLLRSGDVDNILFTVDWHPSIHCSFKSNGGIWPVHCLQYSEGASIPNALLKECMEQFITYQIIRKGELEEQYSAFADVHQEGHKIVVRNGEQTINLPADKPIVVCGLAGDYCVFESIKGLTPFRPCAFMPGIAFIGDEKPFHDYMNEKGLTEIK